MSCIMTRYEATLGVVQVYFHMTDAPTSIDNELWKRRRRRMTSRVIRLQLLWQVLKGARCNSAMYTARRRTTKHSADISTCAITEQFCSSMAQTGSVTIHFQYMTSLPLTRKGKLTAVIPSQPHIIPRHTVPCSAHVAPCYCEEIALIQQTYSLQGAGKHRAATQLVMTGPALSRAQLDAF